jgi:hypothetical protein
MAEKNVSHECNHLRYTLGEELIPKSTDGAFICTSREIKDSNILENWFNLMLFVIIAVKFKAVVTI